MPAWLTTWCVYNIFIVLIKILFAVHLKHSRFWPSADVKPMSNELANAKPRQCIFALSVCSLCRKWIINFKLKWNSFLFLSGLKTDFGLFFFKMAQWNGATTLSITTFSITTLSVMKFSTTRLRIKIFSIMTLSKAINKMGYSASRHSA